MGDEKKKTSRSPLAAAAYGGPVDGNSLESVTPLSMEPEWDPYLHRKYGVGLQPIVGVLRNDRTPLNTPYTPQLMKLHLKRHEAYDERDEYEERPGKQLVTTVKSKIVFVMQPVHKIRICTSPIWISGIAVLFVRLFMRSQPSIEDEFSPDPDEGDEDEEEETSPHHPNSMYRRAHLTNNHSQRGYG
ncbi:hypothetical protein AM587_10008404 [Phytophthora nicotianae]|uniref:Uncharacterized protein n=1 Tax=Phytophthora nicotianae TaxID=4792 RepID=A0A0W8C6R9_PHYNI|nr:hypothetical protein AM587_10008404 [Phytophthora nicotianae]